MVVAKSPTELATWPRRDYFYYFTKMMPTGFNVTVTVDITATYDAVKTRGLHFFPIYLYLITQLLSEQPEFMITQEKDQLYHFETLTPSYSLYHQDDDTISGMWTAYSPDLATFYQHYEQDRSTYQNHHGVVVKPNQPENAYMINMMPSLHFSSYTPLSFNGLPNFLPVIEAGQYKVVADRRLMPVSFTIHHAVADGHHVSRFFEKLQARFDEPDKWLNISK